MLASIRNFFIFSLPNGGEKMKKLIILLCLLVVTALLIAQTAPDTFRNERGPNENAGIVFDLDATTYGNQNDTTMTTPGVGDYIRVDVYAINVHNLDTYEFEVLYNQNQLDYITATATNPITYEQNILTTNGGTALGWMIDSSTSGVLSLAYTLAGTDTLEAPEGEGLIADILFQVLSTIGDSLTFGDVYFYDSFGVMDIITDKGIAIIPGSVSVDNIEFDSIFKEIKLENYPNPFNPTTTISFSIPEEGKVELCVYNIKGQKVKALINEKLNAGAHQVIWHGKDENGKSVSSGIYFYKMDSGRYTSVMKMILLK